MSIRTSNDHTIHRWEITFNTGDYLLKCSKDDCEVTKITSCRNRLCLTCKNGNYREISYCCGGKTKYCNHGSAEKHLVFMCDNRNCEMMRNERL
jgi:hypothetical protein